MKTVAIVQRGIAKDFVDLRALMLSFNVSLSDLINAIHRKYKVSEEYTYQVKKSLVYFDDAENSLADVTIVTEGQKMRLDRKGWNEVKEFFNGIVFG